MSTITKWLSITLVDLWADGTQWPWHQRSCAEYVGILHSQLKSLPRGLGGGDFHQVILHEESTWLDLFRIFYALPKTEGLVWGWKCLNVWTPSGRLYFTFCAVTRGPLHRATERDIICRLETNLTGSAPCSLRRLWEQFQWQRNLQNRKKL